MTVFGKRSNASRDPSRKNAVPGVFSLLERTHAFIFLHKELVAGFAAWTLFPPLFLLGLPYLPEAAIPIIEIIIKLLDLLLTLWVVAAFILTFTTIDPSKEKAEAIGKAALAYLPVLIYIHALITLAWWIGIILILPGIAVAIWFSFAKIIAVIENEKTVASLQKSRELVRGRFFRILGRSIGGNLIIGSAYFFLCLIVFGLISEIGHIDFAQYVPPADQLFSLSFAEEFTLPTWIDALLRGLMVPFIPYFTLYWVVLYEDLKKA